MAFLSQVKVKGKRYIYLTEYIGKKNSIKSTEIHVYGFGVRETALEKMKQWKNDFSKFPKELIERGYDKEDLNEWLTTLETGKSKTGRSTKFG